MTTDDDLRVLTELRDEQLVSKRTFENMPDPSRSAYHDRNAAVLTRIIDALTDPQGYAKVLLSWTSAVGIPLNLMYACRAGALALQRDSREAELRAALKEFAWHRGSCEASMMTPVDYDNLESEEYYVSGPCTCGYDDFAKKHPDAQSFIYDERNNRKTTYTCRPWSEERQKATDAQRAARAALGGSDGQL